VKFGAFDIERGHFGVGVLIERSRYRGGGGSERVIGGME
jgi:hypothetical protein